MGFNPIYKPNQLILGTGNIAIVTGWTPKERVAKKLEPSDYAVIGNLYSPTRGINFLVRNLLANPQVANLIILNSTREDKNSGSCQCLKDFFDNGVTEGVNDVEKDCWVINSEIKGYIDLNIPFKVLDQMRDSLAVVSVKFLEEVKSGINIINRCCFLDPWMEQPMIFPYTEPTSETKPGVRYGHRIEGKTIAETWVKILHRIKTTGTIRPTGYDGQWQELIDLMAVITDEPEDFYFPEPNYLPIDREYLKNYIPQILDDAPYTEGVKYTYGQRLRSWFGWANDQIEAVISKLIREIDSASAVMGLWDPGRGFLDELADAPFGRGHGDSDHDHGGSPCLNHIWCRVVDGELSLTATLRSNDMFSAFPANAMGLRALQQHITNEINWRSSHNLTMGPLITISQSAHIYDDTWENVERLIATQYEKIVEQEIKNYSDPVGNFLIEVDRGLITVTHLSPSGEVVGNWKRGNALRLIRDVVIDIPAIQPAHIGYLAREIERAVQLGKNYIQDK